MTTSFRLSPRQRKANGLPLLPRIWDALSILTTTFRPNPSQPSIVAYAAWVRTASTQLALYPGYEGPGPTTQDRGPEMVPVAARATLLACFNSGFYEKDSAAGFYTHGQLYFPMVDGLATVVSYNDGHIALIDWQGGPTPSPDIRHRPPEPAALGERRKPHSGRGESRHVGGHSRRRTRRMANRAGDRPPRQPHLRGGAGANCDKPGPDTRRRGCRAGNAVGHQSGVADLHDVWQRRAPAHLHSSCQIRTRFPTASSIRAPRTSSLSSSARPA